MKLRLFFHWREIVYCGSLRIHKWSGVCAIGNKTSQHQCQPFSVHESHVQQVHKVSVVVSKLGYTNLIFIESGAVISRQYYREVSLVQELLPVICSIAGNVFVFRQDNAPTHTYGRVSVPWDTSFINCDMWPTNITDLNSVDYHFVMLLVWNSSCYRT